jgi:hypothetical protein
MHELGLNIDKFHREFLRTDLSSYSLIIIVKPSFVLSVFRAPPQATTSFNIFYLKFQLKFDFYSSLYVSTF